MTTRETTAIKTIRACEAESQPEVTAGDIAGAVGVDAVRVAPIPRPTPAQILRMIATRPTQPPQGTHVRLGEDPSGKAIYADGIDLRNPEHRRRVEQARAALVGRSGR